MSDTLKKYLTTDHSTRIQTLRLTKAWQTGLAHQDLPPAVVQLLGELAAASVLLAGNIKFNGSVVLQLQGNGPVRLILVECTAGLELRATAQLRDDSGPLSADATLQSLLNADGKGRFTVLLDPAAKHEGSTTYQGIVPLEGETVAAALEHYMKRSEQLDTHLWLAADGQYCAGLLLQRMPGAASADDSPAQAAPVDDTWSHCLTLASTLQRHELLSVQSDILIDRLFRDDDLLAFPANDVRWHCPCSRARVAGMLRTLGRSEIEDILAQQGHVHITCNFCGKSYDFDSVDCAQLFADFPDHSRVPGSSSMH